MNRKILQTICVLLALVLMTSTATAGTFAKYVLKAAPGMDSARVAKWGVTTAVTGSAFATKYVDGTTTHDIDVSVKSNNAGKIIAPGTSGSFAGLRIAGTPEVAVKVETDATLSLANWSVNGVYYCPLKITINGRTYYGMDYPSSSAFVSAVEKAFEAGNGVYPPNTDLSEIEDLSGAYSWVWDFKGTDGKQTDAKDSVLGKRAANGASALISLSLDTNITQYVGEVEPDDDDDLGDGGEFEIPDDGTDFWG